MTRNLIETKTLKHDIFLLRPGRRLGGVSSVQEATTDGEKNGRTRFADLVRRSSLIHSRSRVPKGKP